MSGGQRAVSVRGAYVQVRITLNVAVGRTVRLSALGQTLWRNDTLLEGAEGLALSVCCVDSSVPNRGLRCYLRTLVLQRRISCDP